MEMTMTRNFAGKHPRFAILMGIAVLVFSLALAGCGGPGIALHYPSEILDFSQGTSHIPSLFIDRVTDMRPVEQRNGAGHFFSITYPKDSAWIKPVTEIYGEALAQDLDQTQLVELVPFPGQAEYVLSVDLLSLSSRMTRSPKNYVVTAMVGAGLGMALGDDASGRIKRALLFGVLASAAIPMPTNHHAEAEVRMTLRDRGGKIIWQEACFGEFNGRKSMAPTARMDQELVDRFLTRAIKRANGCLLGQLRQAFLKSEVSVPDQDQP